MSQFVRIAAVQFKTLVDQPDQWKTHNARTLVLTEIADAMGSLKGLGIDLVVFSEGIEGVGQNFSDAEDPDAPGAFLGLYRDFAKSERCHLAGSSKTRRGGKVYNSTVFFAPGGDVLGIYDKTNLTIGEIEEGLTSGKGPVVVDTDIGRLGGIICFDLNFESLRSQYRALGPDILVFSSMFHGGLQQQTWAYDCKAYFVCSWQDTGTGIFAPFGRCIAQTHIYENIAVGTVNLDRAMVHLDFNGEKFPAIRKKYADEVSIDIPPNIGTCLILSNTDKRSAMDVVKEFELELVDDYFSRATDANAKNRPAG